MNAPRERWVRAQEILFSVSSLPEGDRAAAVAKLCGADGGLAAEVKSLLQHAVRMGNFLEEPALGTDFVLLPATASAATGGDGERDEMIGRTVGRYRIERRIASGGMGTVYLAVRADEQFTQRVALKIVKRGMDTDEILQRFRRERQTLAALEHPNIARLIDGGATESGQPYLVMEFVEGEPIDSYCNQNRLGIDARLHLFLIVCDAVRHAHQNLVVHRDLKPGNILVTHDGTPKLLDFGIASVIDATGMRQVTAARERRLTPEYASPEQIAGAAVATTTDVYSLGVILYELLTGCRPYHFTTGTPEDIEHVVVENQPLAPSEAARRFEPPEARRDAASARRCTPAQLIRRLRGDLDTIVLTAMHKDADRRYSSVERLALDLRLHLDRLPVTARRDSFAYRANKFVHRHTVATTLAVLSLLLLVAGGGAFAWQARVARRERDAAYVARAQWEAITDFLGNMLGAVDPSRSGKDVTVREVLDDAAGRLNGELHDQPLVQASLRSTIGSTYFSLGLYEDAEAQLRQAYQQRLALLGPHHHDVAQSMCELARLFHAKGSFDDAAAMLEGALDIMRSTSGLENANVAVALSSLGAVRRAQGRLDEAERLQRQALDIRRHTGGVDNVDEAESMNNLAGVLMTQKRFDEAEPLLEDALRIRRERLGAEHPLVAQSTDNLAVLLSRKGAFDAAEPLYRQALDLETHLLGPSHPDVAVTRRNLATLLLAKGNLAEAEELLRQCLAAREKLFEASDPRRVITLLDIADVLLAQGQGDAGAGFVESALEATRELDPATDARAAALARGAAFFDKLGQPECAAQLRTQVAETPKDPSPTHPKNR